MTEFGKNTIRHFKKLFICKVILGILGVMFCLFLACARIIPNSESQAKIITRDKVILIGKFVPPKEPSKFTFILLHGLASNKNEWYGFADKLSHRGYGYLAVDIRGHGESNKTTNGADIDIKYFGRPGPGSEWNKIIDDVDVMVQYLIKTRDIRKNSIALAGASIGANIALIYSANHKFVPLVILLSPGLNYIELLTAPAMKKYGERPVAIAASPGDKYAFESSSRLMTIAKEIGASVVFFEGKKNQHGVQMFDGQFENEIITWLDSIHD
ncbi:MAG: alpha/beta fold hydrolase [Elusimicrobiota bacterium]